MANKKISELEDAGYLTLSSYVPVVEYNTDDEIYQNAKTTLSQVRDVVKTHTVGVVMSYDFPISSTPTNIVSVSGLKPSTFYLVKAQLFFGTSASGGVEILLTKSGSEVFSPPMCSLMVRGHTTSSTAEKTDLIRSWEETAGVFIDYISSVGLVTVEGIVYTGDVPSLGITIQADNLSGGTTQCLYFSYFNAEETDLYILD